MELVLYGEHERIIGASSRSVADALPPRPPADLIRQINGLSPFPGAWVTWNGERLKLLAARAASGQGTPGTMLDDALTIACGTGALQLTRLQRAGKAAQPAADFLRGNALSKGERL